LNPEHKYNSIINWCRYCRLPLLLFYWHGEDLSVLAAGY